MEKKQYMMPQMKAMVIKDALMELGSNPIDNPPITDPEEELSKEEISGSKSVWED